MPILYGQTIVSHFRLRLLMADTHWLYIHMWTALMDKTLSTLAVSEGLRRKFDSNTNIGGSHLHGLISVLP